MAKGIVSANFKDLTGQRFGMLLVVRRSPWNYRTIARWECVCDCGRRVAVIGKNLRLGNSRSCGCRARDAAHRTRFIDLRGRSFGLLTVTDEEPDRRGRHWYWQCRCACGAITTVSGSNLRCGQVRSCGCLQRDATTAPRKHGRAKTPEYNVHQGMIGRCHRPNYPGYNTYGARGVTVCKRWRGPEGFANFLADVGERPSPLHTLDRVDNCKGYSPSNCRWATRRQQANNTTRNRWLTHGGETLTIGEWAERTGFSRYLIAERIARGWSTEAALTRPKVSPRHPRKAPVS